jgi:hypothetical protein
MPPPVLRLPIQSGCLSKQSKGMTKDNTYTTVMMAAWELSTWAIQESSSTNYSRSTKAPARDNWTLSFRWRVRQKIVEIIEVKGARSKNCRYLYSVLVKVEISLRFVLYYQSETLNNSLQPTFLLCSIIFEYQGHYEQLKVGCSECHPMETENPALSLERVGLVAYDGSCIWKLGVIPVRWWEAERFIIKISVA